MKALYHISPESFPIRYHDIGFINALIDLKHETNIVDDKDVKCDDITDIDIEILHFTFNREYNWKNIERRKSKGTKLIVWGEPLNLPKEYAFDHERLHPPGHLNIMEKGLIDLCIAFYPEDGLSLYYSPWKDEYKIPILSLPFAADVTVMKPQKENPVFAFDLLCPGDLASNMGNLLMYLRPLLRDYQMICTGNDWDSWPVWKLDCSYQELPMLLSSVGLVPTVHHRALRNQPGMPVNQHIFQSIAGGAMVVSDNVPSLRQFFDDDEVPTADTPEDYKKMVDFFLMPHPPRTKRVWEKAYKRILAEHTYHHRVERLLKEITQQ